MAGRFPLYTDADVHGPVIDALRAAGWDTVPPLWTQDGDFEGLEDVRYRARKK